MKFRSHILLAIIFCFTFLYIIWSFFEENSEEAIEDENFKNKPYAYEIEQRIAIFGKPHPFFGQLPLLRGDPKVLCPNGITVFFMIHTAPFALKRREIIRETWGHKRWQTKFGFKIIFVLGKSKFKDENRLLTKEKAENEDILQFDFVEHYRNLSIKYLSWSRFISTHCKSAKIVVKLDDDVLPNIFWFSDIRIKDSAINSENTLICAHECEFRPVCRNKDLPWYMPIDAYPHALWPRFCAGAVVINSGDILPRLVNTVEKREKYISTDDALFTGVLPEELKIPRTMDSTTYVVNMLTNTSAKMMIQEKVMFGLFDNVASMKRVFDELQRFNGFLTEVPDISPRRYDKIH